MLKYILCVFFFANKKSLIDMYESKHEVIILSIAQKTFKGEISVFESNHCRKIIFENENHWYKKNKTLWPFFMDGVELPQG